MGARDIYLVIYGRSACEVRMHVRVYAEIWFSESAPAVCGLLCLLLVDALQILILTIYWLSAAGRCNIDSTYVSAVEYLDELINNSRAGIQ